MPRPFFLSATLIALGLIAGCSRNAVGTVHGTVIVDGQPMGGFDVIFHSQADGTSVMGAAKAEGRYELYRGRGATDIPCGEYRVTLTPNSLIDGVPLPKVKLPENVTQLEQATIVKTIAPGPNVIDIEVSSQ
ncbi:hypothetical protein [Planctomicrobium sp. SH664]|uniref:hypothetical protein n=1 Tax=Planctomicrobium sp. SH664 TaxID=3448125 RepID=UPI003F5B659D